MLQGCTSPRARPAPQPSSLEQTFEAHTAAAWGPPATGPGSTADDAASAAALLRQHLAGIFEAVPGPQGAATLCAAPSDADQAAATARHNTARDAAQQLQARLTQAAAKRSGKQA